MKGVATAKGVSWCRGVACLPTPAHSRMVVTTNQGRCDACLTVL
jgi:hypothetical protein